MKRTLYFCLTIILMSFSLLSCENNRNKFLKACIDGNIDTVKQCIEKDSSLAIKELSAEDKETISNYQEIDINEIIYQYPVDIAFDKDYKDLIILLTDSMIKNNFNITKDSDEVNKSLLSKLTKTIDFDSFKKYYDNLPQNFNDPLLLSYAVQNEDEKILDHLLNDTNRSYTVGYSVAVGMASALHKNHIVKLILDKCNTKEELHDISLGGIAGISVITTSKSSDMELIDLFIENGVDINSGPFLYNSIKHNNALVSKKLYNSGAIITDDVKKIVLDSNTSNEIKLFFEPKFKKIIFLPKTDDEMRLGLLSSVIESSNGELEKTYNGYTYSLPNLKTKVTFKNYNDDYVEYYSIEVNGDYVNASEYSKLKQLTPYVDYDYDKAQEFKRILKNIYKLKMYWDYLM